MHYQITNKFQSGETTDKWPDNMPASLRMVSHDWVLMNTGHLLMDYERDQTNGEAFVGPLICQIDRDEPTDFMPTLFLSPTLITTKIFYQDLLTAGINNIEAFPVQIRDPDNDTEINDYVLLNVLGRVACADMSQSEANDISGSGEADMQSMTHLVIDAEKVGDLDLFLLNEDTSCIIISDRAYQIIKNNVYTGVYFEPLRTV